MTRDYSWYDNLIYKRTYNQVSYINKIFSISQSATLTALFTKESLAIRSVKNADCFTAESCATLPVFAERSHHPPLHREGKFCCLLGLLFIAENQFK